MNAQRLPVLDVVDQIRSVLADPGSAVLVAPPGTGKTTGVAPELLGETWADRGRIVITQPRRLAARAAAARMASLLGEPVGATVGYSVRGDRRVGPATRIELVTEGLLLRRLQADPTLDGVTAVLIDELHERSIDVDLLLTLLIDVRSSVRPDLRLLAMSATLDPDPVAAVLGGSTGSSPVVTATAPIHPVTTLHRPGSAHDRLEDRVSDVVHEALTAGPQPDGVLGDVLVFLPGRGEIRRTAERLRRSAGPLRADLVVHELHGSVPPAVQDAALRPDPDGRRRVVLATSIAETSITVDGVRIVIDSGRRRTVRVHPGTGLPGLITEAVSMAGADQRRGRAGRTGPGTCYRMWSPEEERHRRTADRPEISDGDVSSLVLQVLEWGALPKDLAWLDPPGGTHLDAAWDLLEDLGAISGRTGEGQERTAVHLTARGRALAELGFHPRLAAVVLAASDGPLGAGGAAELAALLEVDLPGDVDLVDRLHRLQRGDAPREVSDAVSEWRRRIRNHAGPSRGTGPSKDTGPADDDLDAAVGAAVVAGYRDRLARRRPGARTDDRGREQAVYQLVRGGEVAVRPSDHPMTASGWLAVVGLDRGPAGSVGRAQLAVTVDDAVAMDALADLITEHREVTWDSVGRQVTAVTVRRVGGITLTERPWRDPPVEGVRAALAHGVATTGPADVFDRWPEADELMTRLAIVHTATGSGTSSPQHSSPQDCPPHESHAEGGIDPLLDRVAASGRTTRGDLARVDVARYLSDGLQWSDRQALDRLAPTHLQLPSGRRATISYGPDGPLIATRLQDLLGCDVQPTVGDGRVPIVVELLSPAGRPLQRTADLPGFWRGSYAAVRAEMRGRYPKHLWPERPWE